MDIKYLLLTAIFYLTISLCHGEETPSNSTSAESSGVAGNETVVASTTTEAGITSTVDDKHEDNNLSEEFGDDDGDFMVGSDIKRGPMMWWRPMNLWKWGQKLADGFMRSSSWESATGDHNVHEQESFDYSHGNRPPKIKNKLKLLFKKSYCNKMGEENKSGKPEFCKNRYSKGVMVEHWENYIEVEPMDNYVYRDQLSNHRSSYNRFGCDDQGAQTTVTRDMLEQVYNKKEPVYAFKPLVNFTSYPCTDNPLRNKLMKKANLAQLPPDYGITDYLSTNQNDYRNPYPSFGKPNDHYIKNVGHKEECRSDEAKNDVSLAIANAKIEAATSSGDPITSIYTKHIQPLKDKGLPIVTQVPSFTSAKHSLYGSRNRGLQVNKTVYKNFREVEVGSTFLEFLVADYYNDEDNERILVFADKKNIECINEYDEIFIDGTFKSVPSPFYQLVIIHGENGSTIENTNVVPLIYMSEPKETKFR